MIEVSETEYTGFFEPASLVCCHDIRGLRLAVIEAFAVDIPAVISEDLALLEVPSGLAGLRVRPPGSSRRFRARSLETNRTADRERWRVRAGEYTGEKRPRGGSRASIIA